MSKFGARGGMPEMDVLLWPTYFMLSGHPPQLTLHLFITTQKPFANESGRYGLEHAFRAVLGQRPLYPKKI